MILTPRSIAALCLAATVLPAAAQDQAASTDPAPAAAPAVTIQLNKLEDVDGTCRSYFIVDNAMKEPIRTLQLDTFIFDADGVISTRLALTFQNIRAAREKVALFDFALRCDTIGRMLVNDVLACEGPAGPSEACVVGLATESIASAPLEY